MPRLRCLVAPLCRGRTQRTGAWRGTSMNHQQDSGYYLPRETAMLLTTNQLNKCKNLGLILDKYPPQTAIQNSAKKGDWLRTIASRSYIDAELLRSVYSRWLNMTDAVGAQHFSAATDWRMVVGLGGETV